MNEQKLIRAWLDEEQIAHICGWDFSHLDGRLEEENTPWCLRDEIRSRLSADQMLLDMDTGGGEFLRSLGHPPARTAATEGYPPNIALCRAQLIPAGIDFHAAESGGVLPFADASFDMVSNRHGSYDAREVFRVLKPGGYFITQQVGAENDRELVDLLLPGTPMPFSRQYAGLLAEELSEIGFAVERAEEAYPEMRFRDVGAVVWFARIIEWEFPSFSVERCLDRLFAAQKRMCEEGCLSTRTHRILLIAHKGIRGGNGCEIS